MEHFIQRCTRTIEGFRGQLDQLRKENRELKTQVSNLSKLIVVDKEVPLNLTAKNQSGTRGPKKGVNTDTQQKDSTYADKIGINKNNKINNDNEMINDKMPIQQLNSQIAHNDTSTEIKTSNKISLTNENNNQDSIVNANDEWKTKTYK